MDGMTINHFLWVLTMDHMFRWFYHVLPCFTIKDEKDEKVKTMDSLEVFL
jgi:hypothetical protein